MTEEQFWNIIQQAKTVPDDEKVEALATAREALNVTRKLAQQHGQGFFDVSSTNGEILFPRFPACPPV